MRFDFDPSAYPKKPPLESYRQIGTFSELYYKNINKGTS